jgi:tetratricopeptide (TPR) repeat protein
MVASSRSPPLARLGNDGVSLLGIILTGVKRGSLNSKACRLAQSGQFDRAIAAFDELIKMAPEFADGHYNRGNAYTLDKVKPSNTHDHPKRCSKHGLG